MISFLFGISYYLNCARLLTGFTFVFFSNPYVSLIIQHVFFHGFFSTTDGHAEDVAVMSRCINGIPNVITDSHSFVSDRDHSAKVELLFDSSEIWAVSKTIIGIARKEFISYRYSIVVHKQPHLHDRIWTVFFLDTFAKKIILLICFKVIIRHIIVDKSGVSAIVRFDLIIHPNLECFLVFI